MSKHGLWKHVPWQLHGFLLSLTCCFIIPISRTVNSRERQEDESKWRMNEQHLIFILVRNRAEEMVDAGMPNNKRDKGMWKWNATAADVDRKKKYTKKKLQHLQSEILSCSLVELYSAATSDFLDTFPLGYILRKTPAEVVDWLKQMMVNLTPWKQMNPALPPKKERDDFAGEVLTSCWIIEGLYFSFCSSCCGL